MKITLGYVRGAAGASVAAAVVVSKDLRGLEDLINRQGMSTAEASRRRYTQQTLVLCVC